MHELDADRAAFGCDFEGGSAPVEYLWWYLQDIGARSFVREENYVDRHYLDDFTNYYARSFRPPEAHCRRLHYFRCDHGELESLLDAFYRSGDSRDLNEQYLGFVVRRPLIGARLGRTVLITYEGDSGRLYTVIRPYRVHIGSLSLTVHGLAYQQQDVGAAVCASTALWCALQKVANMSGHRTPTPSAITIASESPYAASEGLTDPQMATALARLGYAADWFVPVDRALFRARVAACLRSHLPVVLLVANGEAHAVTCTGYREPSELVEVPTSDATPTKTIRMRTGSIRTIYVHDDNVGSHAHYELHDSPPEGFDYGNDRAIDPDDVLWLVRGRLGEERPGRPDRWEPSCLMVLGALVPKPSKLRLPAERLIHLAAALRETAELIFVGLKLNYDVAFTSGVAYRQILFDRRLEPNQRWEFDMNADLPRHLAVVSVSAGDDHLLDFLIDATSIDLAPDEDSLLAVVAPGVPVKSAAWKRLLRVCEEVEVPAIGGVPPSTRASA